MGNGMTSYHAVRHPLLTGILLVILSPYLLAFVLLFVVAFAVAALLDMAAGRK